MAVSPAGFEDNTGWLLGGAVHLSEQIVDVDVRVTVEIVVVTSKVELVPETMVLVTGQVVKVV